MIQYAGISPFFIANQPSEAAELEQSATIKDQLLNGFVLRSDGTWDHVDPRNARVTNGGNVDPHVMTYSLQFHHLEALAKRRGVTLDHLWEEIMQAMEAVGALKALAKATKDPELNAERNAYSDEQIRQWLRTAEAVKTYEGVPSALRRGFSYRKDLKPDGTIDVPQSDGTLQPFKIPEV